MTAPPNTSKRVKEKKKKKKMQALAKIPEEAIIIFVFLDIVCMFSLYVATAHPPKGEEEDEGFGRDTRSYPRKKLYIYNICCDCPRPRPNGDEED